MVAVAHAADVTFQCRDGFLMPYLAKDAVKRLLFCAFLSIPAGVHADAVSPRRLVEVADISGPVVSPDGTLVAFRIEQASIERNTYDSAWYVQSLDGDSLPRKVGDGGVPLRDSAGLSLPAVAAWSVDGRSIYYRALLDGKIDIWRASADGSSAMPLTHDAADVRAFSLSVEGSTLSYSVGATRDEVIAAEQAEYERGIHIDENVPTSQNLFRSGYVEGRLATQRLGFWFDRVSLLANVPDRRKAIDLLTGERHDARASGDLSQAEGNLELPKELPAPWKLARDRQYGRIAMLTRVGDGEGLANKPDVQLAVLLPSKAARPIKCEVDLCVGKAISDIQWRPNGEEVVFTVTDPKEGHAQSLFRWSINSGTVHPILYSGGLLNGGERYGRASTGCGLSSAVLVCVTAEADRPPRLERIGIESGDRLVLFDPNKALAMDIAKATPARLIRWKDASGHTFTGRFFAARHTGDEAPPLFVTYYHCFGFLRGGYGDEWPLASLAESGVSALCINAAPYRLNAVERFNQGLSAVESAVDLLASAGEIDRTRIGMGGLSFGTEVTMWTAMNSGLLTAASVTSPLITRTMYLHGSLREEQFFSGLRMAWQLGPAEETPEQWRTLAAEFNLDRIRSPILMQMPEQEYLWALDYAIPLVRNHKADLYAFPHEAHFKFQPRHLFAASDRNLDWFRFWLQDFENNDLRKGGQYEHWRAMQAHQCAAAIADGAALPWYCQS